MVKRLRSLFLLLIIALGSNAQYVINPYNYGYGAKMLDGYSVSAAYSLVKLKSDYTGFVVLIRSGTANAFGYLSFDSNDEVSMSSTVSISAAGTSGLTVGTTVSLTTFCNSGGLNQSAFVITWYDQSGNSFNVTQTTTIKQPRIVNAGTLETKNGKPAVYFDGSDDILKNISYPSTISDGSANSYFVVASNEVASSMRRVISSRKFTVPTGEWLVQIDRSANKRNFGIVNSAGSFYEAVMPSQLDNSNYRLLSGFATTGKVMSGYANGSGGTGNTYVSPYSLDGFGMGGRIDEEAGLFLQGHVGAAIILNGDYSSDRTIIENKLNTYYTIY